MSTAPAGKTWPTAGTSRRRRPWALLWILAAVVLLGVLARGEAGMLKVGDAAPDFTARDDQGAQVTLSDYRGKNPVVLVFYPADQTPVCTTQLCEIRDTSADFKAAGAVVFGVNPASADSHRRFVEKHTLPFRLVVDEGKEIARNYQTVLGWGPVSITNRSVYVIGKDGKILFAERGKPTPEKVLAALRAA